MADITDSFSQMDIDSEYRRFIDSKLVHTPLLPSFEPKTNRLNTIPECNSSGINSCVTSGNSFSGSEFGPNQFQKPAYIYRPGPSINTVNRSLYTRKDVRTGCRFIKKSVTFSLCKSLETHTRKQHAKNTAGDSLLYRSCLTRVSEFSYVEKVSKVGYSLLNEPVKSFMPEPMELCMNNSQNEENILAMDTTEDVIQYNRGLHNVMGESLVFKSPGTKHCHVKEPISKDVTMSSPKFTVNGDAKISKCRKAKSEIYCGVVQKWLNHAESVPEFGSGKVQKIACVYKFESFNNTVNESLGITGKNVVEKPVIFPLNKPIETDLRKEYGENIPTKRDRNTAENSVLRGFGTHNGMMGELSDIKTIPEVGYPSLNGSAASFISEPMHLCINKPQNEKTGLTRHIEGVAEDTMHYNGLHDTAMGKSLVVMSPGTWSDQRGHLPVSQGLHEKPESAGCKRKRDLSLSLWKDPQPCLPWAQCRPSASLPEVGYCHEKKVFPVVVTTSLTDETLDHSNGVIELENGKKSGMKRKNAEPYSPNKKIKRDAKDFPTCSTDVKHLLPPVIKTT